MWNSIASLFVIAAIASCLSGTSTFGKEAEAASVTKHAVTPAISISPQRTYPGDAIFIRSKQAQSITLFQKTYQLQPSGGEYVRFIPVPFDVKPGVHVAQTKDKQLHASNRLAKEICRRLDHGEQADEQHAAKLRANRR